MEKLGRIIKEARVKKKLTQDYIAHLTNKSQSLVALWENGKRDPNTLDMIKIIVALDIKIEKLKQCIDSMK
jgi:transcriptional regulator with XRE-family HTH domain